MIEFMCWAFIIITIIVMIYKCAKMYRNAKNFIERALQIIVVITIFVPIIIYYLDRYDVPTRIGIANNIDSARWFDFASSYTVGIVGSIISGAILVLITLKQIDIQIESNKNDKRIENSPVFDYLLISSKSGNMKYNHKVETGEKGKNYHAFFKIENIGLNHSKNISFLIKINDLEDRKISLNGHQSFIKKCETVWIDLVFELEQNKYDSRKLEIQVCYYDLLNNQYIQVIEAVLNTNKDKANIDISNFKVLDESLIKKG